LDLLAGGEFSWPSERHCSGNICLVQPVSPGRCCFSHCTEYFVLSMHIELVVHLSGYLYLGGPGLSTFGYQAKQMVANISYLMEDRSKLGFCCLLWVYTLE
jgi:hypothetical protein